jgi:hypothetical protein
LWCSEDSSLDAQHCNSSETYHRPSANRTPLSYTKLSPTAFCYF